MTVSGGTDAANPVPEGQELVDDGIINNDGNNITRSIIAVNEPNQLVGAVPAGGGNTESGGGDARENLKELKALSQGLDEKDQQAKRRIKQAKKQQQQAITPPGSPIPGGRWEKRERGQFPAEKFGGTTGSPPLRRPAPVTAGTSGRTIASASSANSRGLHNNQFPNEKFGRPPSSGSRGSSGGATTTTAAPTPVTGATSTATTSATTTSAASAATTNESNASEDSTPGAHPSQSTTILDAGRQAPQPYQTVHLQIPNVEPTIEVEPTIQPPPELPTPTPQQQQQQEDYLVEASLVSLRYDEPNNNPNNNVASAEVLEAQEVTLKDVFQIKGVKCLFGSILGCFLVVLAALIVAIVLLTSDGGGGSSDSAMEPESLVSSPTFPPTSLAGAIIPVEPMQSPAPTVVPIVGVIPPVSEMTTGAPTFAPTFEVHFGDPGGGHGDIAGGTFTPTISPAPTSETSESFSSEEGFVTTMAPSFAKEEAELAPTPPVAAMPGITESPQVDLDNTTTTTSAPTDGRTNLPPPPTVAPTTDHDDDDSSSTTMAPAPAPIDGGSSSNNQVLLGIIVAAIIMTIAIAVFVPLSLIHMRRKLQQKQQQKLQQQRGAAGERIKNKKQNQQQQSIGIP